MAYIGHYPESNNVFMITGDSGMGMTHCTLGGELILDLIENIPNP
jgi:glycine/D-amino acid oxidase-like deaminating enzyme